MTDKFAQAIDRRRFGRWAASVVLGAAALGTPALVRAQTNEALHDFVPDSEDRPRLLRRISGLRTREWQDHFSSISQDAILVDTRDRVLHYWGEDGFYRIYPTSVPLTDQLTRRGRTEVTLKRPDPEWRPTDAMLGPQPRPAALRRARPRQSTRNTSTKSRLAVLSDPRHQRHPQDRAAVLERLHRAFQRAYPRGLRPGAGRNAGVANLTTPVNSSAATLSKIETAAESWLVFGH